MALEDKLTKQVSVFLENKSGRLLDLCQALGVGKINIRALCIADTSDFGILRLIVDDPDRALSDLREQGFSVGETHVLAVQVPDQPGGLGAVLENLRTLEMNVEYMYAFFTRVAGQAVVVFRVGDEQIPRVLEALEGAGVVILPAKDVYAI
jgi:hypothetical protein